VAATANSTPLCLHVGLEIYIDDEFRPAGAPPAEWAAAPDARGGGGGSPGWAHLGTFEQTRKENVLQPAPWFGARVQKHRGSPRSPPCTGSPVAAYPALVAASP